MKELLDILILILWTKTYIRWKTGETTKNLRSSPFLKQGTVGMFLKNGNTAETPRSSQSKWWLASNNLSLLLSESCMALESGVRIIRHSDKKNTARLFYTCHIIAGNYCENYLLHYRLQFVNLDKWFPTFFWPWPT